MRMSMVQRFKLILPPSFIKEEISMKQRTMIIPATFMLTLSLVCSTFAAELMPDPGGAGCDPDPAEREPGACGR